MVLIWMRFLKTRRQNRARHLSRKGHKKELMRMLREGKEYYPGYLFDVIFEANPTVTDEILWELVRADCINTVYRLSKSVMNQELSNIINNVIHKYEQRERQDKEEDKQRKFAAAKEEIRKRAIRCCPKCGENPKTRVEHRDVDDGWVTHYWKICLACGSEIVDGNGEAVGIARQMGQVEPKDW